MKTKSFKEIMEFTRISSKKLSGWKRHGAYKKEFAIFSSKVKPRNHSM